MKISYRGEVMGGGNARTFIRRILHVKGIIPHQPTLILRHIVPPLRLVHPHLALGAHVVEVLITMHAGFLRRRPAGCVHPRSTSPATV